MKRKIIPWKLIISGLKQELSPDDQILLDRWLASSDNHRLYDELENTWEAIKKDASDYSPDPDYYWKELQSRLKKDKKSLFSRMGVKSVISVAAAIVLMVISISTWMVTSYTKEHAGLQTFTSLYGKSKIALPDGSTVWLNKGSTISYSSLFLKDRSLELDGEALFDVTKNPESPFVVHTAGIQIKVHGTQFNVNSYNRDAEVKVSLIEGSVSIISDNEETHLVPGEIASINRVSHNLAMIKEIEKEIKPLENKLKPKEFVNTDTEELRFESFWANESVYFDHKDLGYICKYLEKWYKVKIVLDPDLLNSQYYTFTLKDEPLELILRIMNKINPISYSFTDENAVYITNVKPSTNVLPMK